MLQLFALWSRFDEIFCHGAGGDNYQSVPVLHPWEASALPCACPDLTCLLAGYGKEAPLRTLQLEDLRTFSRKPVSEEEGQVEGCCGMSVWQHPVMCLYLSQCQVFVWMAWLSVGR